jgi:5-methylcytosine-specific restriction endonuclease McrA
MPVRVLYAGINANRNPRPCRQCGVEFAPEYGDKRRVFYSDKCLQLRNDRVLRGKRRAREYGVEAQSIDPIAIFERDGWRCYMCKTVTPRQLRGTLHDLAPEIDHILPYSAGGAHTLDNVACACRKCNQNKGAKILGLQTVPKVPVGSPCGVMVGAVVGVGRSQDLQQTLC